MNVTIKARVEEVLYEYPEARDDDRWLLIRYLQKYHPELRLFAQYNKLEYAPALETLTRCRRTLQNDEKKVLASPQVQMMRKNRAKSMAVSQ